MKSFVSTVVGGAIGIVALYVVGRVAYQAGRDMAQAEQRYEEMRRKAVELESAKRDNHSNLESGEPQQVAVIEPAPMRKQSTPGLIMGIKRLMGKKESVIGRLVHHPEDHRIEAFVEGDELKVNVKPRAII